MATEGMTADDLDGSQDIFDDGDLRKYYSSIPHMVDDDKRLSPFDRTLYLHYKRVCGESSAGRCWESVRTTSAKTNMSPGQVVVSRNHLRDCEYLAVSVLPNNRGTLDVAVLDIWPENFYRYGGKRVGKRSGGERGRSGGEQKKNQGKNNPRKKGVGKAPDPRNSTPEVQLYRSVTDSYPARANLDDVIKALHGQTEALVKETYARWTGRGYNPRSLGWLDWLKRGGQPDARIPARDNRPHEEPRRGSALAEALKHGGKHLDKPV